jgi:hypothetical protein
MSHTGVGVEVFADEAFFELGYFAFLFVDAEVVVEEGYAAAVIAAVFEAFETFQDDGISFPWTDISDNATHRILFFTGCSAGLARFKEPLEAARP